MTACGGCAPGCDLHIGKVQFNRHFRADGSSYLSAGTLSFAVISKLTLCLDKDCISGYGHAHEHAKTASHL
jgi:hypothetical protein